MDEPIAVIPLRHMENLHSFGSRANGWAGVISKSAEFLEAQQQQFVEDTRQTRECCVSKRARSAFPKGGETRSPLQSE